MTLLAFPRREDSHETPAIHVLGFDLLVRIENQHK